MFCPISIHGEFPDLPIGLWRKGERCRLDIYIINTSCNLIGMLHYLYVACKQSTTRVSLGSDGFIKDSPQDTEVPSESLNSESKE